MSPGVFTIEPPTEEMLKAHETRQLRNIKIDKIIYENMNRYLEAVGEFHENFGHPINEMNSDVPQNLRILRLKLLFEELEELSEATGCRDSFNTMCLDSLGCSTEDTDIRDKKEEIDALADIQYVLSGAVLALGHHENFDEAFEEVQRSNMSKMCNTMQEALDTQEWYIERDGTESHIIEKGDKFIVLRKGDDKILKNKYYSAADLGQFV